MERPRSRHLSPAASDPPSGSGRSDDPESSSAEGSAELPVPASEVPPVDEIEWERGEAPVRPPATGGRGGGILLLVLVLILAGLATVAISHLSHQDDDLRARIEALEEAAPTTGDASAAAERMRNTLEERLASVEHDLAVWTARLDGIEAPSDEDAEEENAISRSLANRVVAVEDQLTFLRSALEATADREALREEVERLEREMQEALDLAAAELRREREERFDAIQDELARIPALEDSVTGLQEGEPRGLWREILRFLDLAEGGVAALQGEALPRKPWHLGRPFRSTVSFRGAEATEVFVAPDAMWIEARLDRREGRIEGQGNFSVLQDRITALLPIGWMARGIIHDDYPNALRITDASGQRSFLLAGYDHEILGDTVFSAILRFDDPTR